MSGRKTYTKEFKQAVINDVKAVAEKLGHTRLLEKEYYMHGKYNKLVIKKTFGCWKGTITHAGLKYRGFTKEEVIEDLQRVSALLNNNMLSCSAYFQNGKYSQASVINLFGSWNGAITGAGLRIFRRSDNVYLDDIKKVADELGQKRLTAKQYQKSGKYSIFAIVRRFKTWKKALAKVGLLGNKKISKENLINDLKRVAADLKQNTVSLPQYYKNGKYSELVYYLAFGSWNKAIEYAGLIPNTILSEQEIMDDLKKVAIQISPQILSVKIYQKLGKYSSSTVRYRFGNWRNALVKSKLKTNKKNRSHKKAIPYEVLINDLQKVAAKSDKKHITSDYYFIHGNYSLSTFYKYGNWSDALKKAGLPYKYRKKKNRIPDGRE